MLHYWSGLPPGRFRVVDSIGYMNRGLYKISDRKSILDPYCIAAFLRQLAWRAAPPLSMSRILHSSILSLDRARHSTKEHSRPAEPKYYSQTARWTSEGRRRERKAEFASRRAARARTRGQLHEDALFSEEGKHSEPDYCIGYSKWTSAKQVTHPYKTDHGALYS